MQTQNNPEIPNGLLWVIFLAKINPDEPRKTQWVTKLQKRPKNGYFLQKNATCEPSGLKNKKKKEPKKKNIILGFWIWILD